jgi:hypothetical protein
MSKSLTFASILVDNDLEIFFLDFEFVEGGLLKFEMLSLILEVKFLVLDSLILNILKYFLLICLSFIVLLSNIYCNTIFE